MKEPFVAITADARLHKTIVIRDLHPLFHPLPHRLRLPNHRLLLRHLCPFHPRPFHRLPNHRHRHRLPIPRVHRFLAILVNAEERALVFLQIVLVMQIAVDCLRVLSLLDNVFVPVVVQLRVQYKDSVRADFNQWVTKSC